MTSQLDDRLAALAAQDSDPALAGLEDQVWGKVQARKAAAGAGSAGVRLALTIAALAIGLAFGALHQPPRQVQAQAHVAELGVLSEDGLLAPSVRLGGGA
ncbi:MAG: hypothetical protein ACXU8W_22030 [Caulobacteraceae bacterium]